MFKNRKQCQNTENVPSYKEHISTVHCKDQELFPQSSDPYTSCTQRDLLQPADRCQGLPIGHGWKGRLGSRGGECSREKAQVPSEEPSACRFSVHWAAARIRGSLPCTSTEMLGSRSAPSPEVLQVIATEEGMARAWFAPTFFLFFLF